MIRPPPFFRKHRSQWDGVLQGVARVVAEALPVVPTADAPPLMSHPVVPLPVQQPQADPTQVEASQDVEQDLI